MKKVHHNLSVWRKRISFLLQDETCTFCLKQPLPSSNPSSHIEWAQKPRCIKRALIFQVLDGRLSILSSTAIGPGSILASALVGLKLRHFRRVHMLHNRICLPLLEAETQTLMRIVLVICLVLVVFHLDELAVNG